MVTFRGARGVCKHSFSNFEVPSRDLIILLKDSETSPLPLAPPHLREQNFSPILFPARPFQLPFRICQWSYQNHVHTSDMSKRGSGCTLDTSSHTPDTDSFRNTANSEPDK